MQAATHVAGAALTAAVLRGFGVEIGPPEVLALVVGSLIPDVDTTTSGVGKFLKPVSRWIESKFGHRTITHSLGAAALFSLLFLPLGAGVAGAMFWGILSHLLLDSLNVNGVPLLWPVRLMFWFWPGRSMRIKYGSGAESGVALVCAVLALVLWPIGGDGFNTSFRRLVASPETAVADYIDMRQQNDVWADVEGFNSETQEPMEGRYRIIEAVGRSGVLVEDRLGHAYQVSQFGQVVAYRIRAYAGEPRVWRDYRVDVGSRVLGDVLDALPSGAANVYLTGLLEMSGDLKPSPAEIGTFPRVALQRGSDNVLELHAARSADVQKFRNAYIRTGSMVIRAEFEPGKAVDQLPITQSKGPRTTVQSIRIDGLPSLAGLLVQAGDRVLEGEPLARYVRPADLAGIRTQAQARALALALEVKALDARGEAAQAAQVVRSPVAGEVAEIRQGQATARGLSVEVVILVSDSAGSTGQQPPPEPIVPLNSQQQLEKLNAEGEVN
ncbi:metal-dependent hydrolase [Deinococcus arenicola]|uniref:Metal-dependent hydrolase n=1 Tax=Deinococcus arenicola TaxID=2994950 RepID=A0ABU4DXD8_9DEIO|nr:metal-dependent hydrolase [Deinococcus sp. ZS9-10]MDV6376627.1 metal-dependent hydrolase [Deinococcus sp. ZS9-10]